MSQDPYRKDQVPNSAARDKVQGTMREAGGRLKESYGALTGKERMEAQGRTDQMAGAVQRKKGTLKDRIKAWIDRR